MWPWEHLAIGYVLGSMAVRGWTGHPPDGRAVGLLAVATQGPDLVDKPLAWLFGILPSGTSLGHSFLVAIPACALVVWLATERGSPEDGIAVAVGYLSHLPGDMLYPVLVGKGGLSLGPFLWPLVGQRAGESIDVLAFVQALVETFTTVLAGPNGLWYVAFEACLLGAAVVWWHLDGRPGAPARGGPER